jgi:hypothetical protein
VKQKLADLHAQNEDEAAMLEWGGESREQLMANKATLEQEVKDVQKKVDAYSGIDPTELENKKNEAKRFQLEAEQFTDEIYAMEGYVKKSAGDDGVKFIRARCYGDELDVEEEGVLKEMA